MTAASFKTYFMISHRIFILQHSLMIPEFLSTVAVPLVSFLSLHT